jgi:hypothetical protein
MRETIIRTNDDARKLHLEMLERLAESNYGAYPCCRQRLTTYGDAPNCKPCSSVIQRIPRNLWPELITRGKGNWLSDIRGRQLKPHNQGSTPLCWAHGSVRALEVNRLYAGMDPLLLSAEQVAYWACNGRMRGGSPDEAVEQLQKRGTCHQEYWPLNSFSIRDNYQKAEADCANHKLLDWLDIENFDDQMTCALNRIAVPIGLRWWGHLVCQLDPIMFDDGTFGIGIDNSWGEDWGDWGYGILHESKGTADLGAFAPLVQTFSNE